MIIAARTLRPDMDSGMVAARVLKAWWDIAAMLSKNVAFKPNSASLAAWKYKQKFVREIQIISCNFRHY